MRAISALGAAVLGILASAAVSSRPPLPAPAAASASTSPSASALVPGVSDDEVRVGMSAALTGPARNLGTDMQRGIVAAFEGENARGGIHGRKVHLLSRDDAYEPDRAGENVHALIEGEHVFAMVGSTGTPTAAVSLPIASAAATPFFGALTGAAMLRKQPPDRWVLNVRASYAEECQAILRGLLDDLKLAPEHLGFFTQSDAYGDAGYEASVKALEARGYTQARRLPRGRYTRNTLDVEGALAELLDPRLDVRAVVMVGTAAPSAKFIRLARGYRMAAIFVNLSFVGSEALAAALGADGEGVVVTQVMPPSDLDLPVLRDFQAAVPPEQRSFVTLEGYVTGRLFAAVLRRAGPRPTPASFVEAFETGSFDVGLADPIAAGEGHQLSHSVWPTVLRAGVFRTLRSFRELH